VLFLQSVRIGAEEDIDDTKGLKPEEVEEIMKEREAKARAQILEMVTVWTFWCHSFANYLKRIASAMSS